MKSILHISFFGMKGFDDVPSRSFLLQCAHDSGKVFELLDARGIEAVIKPRRSSRVDTGSPARGRAVGLFRRLGYREWVRSMDYRRRWAVETAYLAFMRLFGEHSLAREVVNIARELTAKVGLYNMLVNM
jgi:hypothetical protein